MRSCCTVRPDRGYLNRLGKQAGLGLATALFVITILGLLAVFIGRLVEFNAASFSEEMELVQSFYAAESGAQFGMNDLVFPFGVSSPMCPGAVSATEYFFTSGALNNCSASVTCAYVDVDIDGDSSPERFYTLESAGTCGDVTRTIQVRAQ